MLLISYTVLLGPAEQVYPRQNTLPVDHLCISSEDSSCGELILQMNLLGLAGGLIWLSRKCLCYVYYTTNKNMHAISHTKLYVIPQLKSSRSNEAKAIQPCSEPPKSLQRPG